MITEDQYYALYEYAAKTLLEQHGKELSVEWLVTGIPTPDSAEKAVVARMRLDADDIHLFRRTLPSSEPTNDEIAIGYSQLREDIISYMFVAGVLYYHFQYTK